MYDGHRGQGSPTGNPQLRDGSALGFVRQRPISGPFDKMLWTGLASRGASANRRAPHRPAARRRQALLAERCRSGRTGRSRKPLCPYGYRGFESLPLRQFPQCPDAQPISGGGEGASTNCCKVTRATRCTERHSLAESCVPAPSRPHSRGSRSVPPQNPLARRIEQLGPSRSVAKRPHVPSADGRSAGAIPIEPIAPTPVSAAPR